MSIEAMVYDMYTLPNTLLYSSLLIHQLHVYNIYNVYTMYMVLYS